MVIRKVIRRLLGKKQEVACPPIFDIPHNTSRLVFGDSVFLRVSRGDEDKSSLLKMLTSSRLESSEKTFVFAYSALALPHYLLYLLQIGQRIGSLDKIVIPVNYRSFSRQWEANSNWQYFDSMSLLNASLGDSKVNMNSIFDSGAYGSSRAIYSHYGERESNFFLSNLARKSEEVDAILEKRKMGFAFNYLFDKETLISSKRLNAIDLINDKFSNFSEKFCFVVLPINFEGICFLHGNEAMVHIRENLDLICEKLSCRGLKVLDCTTKVDRFGFFNELESTEHLNELGRAILFDEIASVLKN